MELALTKTTIDQNSENLATAFPTITELAELELALIGGGIGDAQV